MITLSTPLTGDIENATHVELQTVIADRDRRWLYLGGIYAKLESPALIPVSVSEKTSWKFIVKSSEGWDALSPEYLDPETGFDSQSLEQYLVDEGHFSGTVS